MLAVNMRRRLGYFVERLDFLLGFVALVRSTMRLFFQT